LPWATHHAPLDTNLDRLASATSAWPIGQPLVSQITRVHELSAFSKSVTSDVGICAKVSSAKPIAGLSLNGFAAAMS
jgi:hypothetical protein